MQPRPGDMGRRVRHQRERSGLDRAALAARAGMAPGYVEHLEEDPDAVPTPSVLLRLAAALGTTADALRGADVEAPPGRGRRGRRPVLREMGRAECDLMVGPGGVGRFVFLEGRGPVALPVNYKVLDGDIVFRTGADAPAALRARQVRVSFEVDSIDEAAAEGWSVLMSGQAHEVTDPDERRTVVALRIEPWAGGTRDRYFRLHPLEVTGRRITADGT